jgi:tetratricopeptide (TPR) repeat protein
MKRMVTRSLILFMVIATNFAICSVSAQTEQVGFVKEYNGENEKTPISGVELVVNNAGSTISDVDGRFVLDFKTMHPGERVDVTSIIKEGYEIFNISALEQWNINPDVPFTIVMVDSKRFKERCDQFFDSSSQSYKAQHQQELAVLEREREQGRITLQQYEEERVRIINSYEEQLQNLSGYINRFARIDLENLSLVEKEILAAIEEGRIGEAIAMYEQQEFINIYIKQVEQRDEEVAQMNAEILNTYEAISRQILMYMIAGGKENFDKVIYLYERTLAADPSNGVVAADYVEFLLQQGIYERAVDVANLAIQTKSLDSDRCATLYHHMACAYLLLHDATSAYKYCMEALALCNDTETLYYTIMHTLGNVYNELGQSDKAISCLQTIIQSDVALTVTKSMSANLLGNIYQSYGRHREAIDSYNSMLRLRGDVARSGYNVIDKIEAQYSECAAYINMARSYFELGEFDKSMEIYALALEICDTLYTYNPDKYANALFNVYLNMGVMYNAMGDNVKALEQTLNAYKYVEYLYGVSPIAFGYNYYMVLNNLGYLSYMCGQYAQSEIYYDRGFFYIDDLYQRSATPNVKLEYARVMINYASLYNDQSMSDKALAKSAVAVEIMDELGVEYGEAVRFEHSLAYRAYIKALYIKGDKRGFKEAVARFESLYGDSAELANIKGEIALLDGKLKLAEKMYRKVLSLSPDFYVMIPSPLNDRFVGSL